MRAVLCRFLACRSGASSIEYALIASLISMGIIGAAAAIGTELDSSFKNVENGLKR